VGKVG
jgi:hypothetical protein